MPQVALTHAAQAAASPEAFRWGAYLGGTDQAVQTAPTAVPALSNVVAIHAGNSSNYALQCVGGQASCASDGVEWAWGNNGNGQLGNGTASGAYGTWISHPVQVQFPAGVHIVAIGEARNDGYAIDSTGQGWAWGANYAGALCLGNAKPRSAPVKVAQITNAVAVEGGQDHVLWLLADGHVMTCGNNKFGQLGNGQTGHSKIPVPVFSATGLLTNIVQISAGNISSAAIDSAGHLYMWGSNEFGRLGVGYGSTIKKDATLVNLPQAAVEVSAGGSQLTSNGSSIALLVDGSVYAWGCDNEGQLGDGGNTSQYLPVRVPLPAGDTFTEVVTGGFTSYALDASGTLWAWGGGNNGQLGTGQRHSMVPVKADSGVDMISSTANNVLDHHTASG